MGVLESAVGYVTGYMPMMMVGSYIFSLNTAAYQELSRSTEYRWPAIERNGQDDALQYSGPGEDTATLEGVVYPQFRGGGAQVNILRALAAKGLPQTVIDGAGNVYGRWVIERITERQSTFSAFGQPMKQEFSVALRRYDGGPSNLIASILGATALGGLVTSAEQAVNDAASSVKSAISSAL